MEHYYYSERAKVIQSDSNHALFCCPARTSEYNFYVYYIRFCSKDGEFYDYYFFFPDINLAYHFFNKYKSFHTVNWVAKLYDAHPEYSFMYVSIQLYNKCLLDNQLSLFNVPRCFSSISER